MKISDIKLYNINFQKLFLDFALKRNTKKSIQEEIDEFFKVYDDYLQNRW